MQEKKQNNLYQFLLLIDVQNVNLRNYSPRRGDEK